MKRFLSFLLGTKERAPHLLDHKEKALIKAGREQFKTMMKKGLTVPIVLL